MSVQEQKHESLIEKRAHALMMMFLTRPDDLLIEEPNEDIGLDYIVRFRAEGKEGLREFGIQLKGARMAATKDEADKFLRPVMKEMKRYGPFLRPVCLVLFTMENDEAWYTWVAEPTESEAGKPLLRSYEAPNCRPLDNRALTEIIEQVDRWHDALLPTLIANGPAGKETRRKGTRR